MFECQNGHRRFCGRLSYIISEVLWMREYALTLLSNHSHVSTKWFCISFDLKAVGICYKYMWHISVLLSVFEVLETGWHNKNTWMDENGAVFISLDHQEWREQFWMVCWNVLFASMLDWFFYPPQWHICLRSGNGKLNSRRTPKNFHISLYDHAM